MKLEDLLKLKKEERPSPQAWEKFDAELKSKMLLTIIEKQSLTNRLRYRFSSSPLFKSALAATSFSFLMAFAFLTHLSLLDSNPLSTELSDLDLSKVEGDFAVNKILSDTQNDLVNASIDFDDQLISYHTNTISFVSVQGF